MSNNLETYTKFLKDTLIFSGAVTFGRGEQLANQFRAVASEDSKWLNAVSGAYDLYSKTKNYSAALNMIHDTLLKMFAADKGQATASVDCANALPPIGKAIYDALKNNKSTIRDSDVRKWRGLTELDCDIHQDNRIRANLWQWEETFSDKGLLERRQVLRSALASSQAGKQNFELIVRY